MNETDRSVDSLLTCCLVPITMNLVFSGLIKRWFSQHQLATLNRSCSRFVIADLSYVLERKGRLSSHQRTIRGWSNEVWRADRSNKYKIKVVKELNLEVLLG